ncbi:MAG: methyl-accepting chemotaxis protein [Clostridia bacterium]|nr:methyl-accepting chemotaxis protein [Clostridia bacterium]
MNIKIRSKLMLLIVLLLLAMGGLGWFSITRIDLLTHDIAAMGTNLLPRTQDVLNAKYYAASLRRNTLQHILSETREEMDTYQSRIEDDAKRYESNMASLSQLLTTEAGRQTYSSLESTWREYHNITNEIVSLSERGITGDAKSLVRGRARELGESIKQTLDELIGLINDNCDAVLAAAQANAARSRTTVLIVILALAAIGTLLGLYLARIITSPLRGLVDVAERVAQGDLTSSPEVRSRDEVGLLAHALGQMVANLRNIIGNTTATARDVAAASEQLAAGAEQAASAVNQISTTVQQLAAGAGEQSSSAATTAEAVERLSANIDHVSKGTDSQKVEIGKAGRLVLETSSSLDDTMAVLSNMRSVAQQNADVSTKGKESVGSVMANIQRISEKTSVATDQIRELDSHSQEISKIVEVINDIADETNLLALNAAIEAARAGEHGRGFAVVADEVRKLAERSSSETKAIEELIERVGRATESTVATIESQQEEVRQGRELSSQAEAILNEINSTALRSVEEIARLVQSSTQLQQASEEAEEAIRDVTSVAEANAAAVTDMTERMGEVKRASENVAAISGETAAAVEEVSASTEEVNASVEEISTSAKALADTAARLQTIAAGFRL